MTHAQDDIDAALLATGALAARELQAARDRMNADPAFAARVQEWEESLAPLALALAPLAPPEGLLEKLEARLDARARFERIAKTLREPEGDWIELSPGLRCKPLTEHSDASRQIVLLDAEPGAVQAPHRHETHEEIYIISGDLIIDSEDFGPGAFVTTKPGVSHDVTTTRTGCRCLIATWS
jgi:quercetin dioxygenase-like cupin family protein